MLSLLNALQEGRLIELPDNHKDHALQILANLIEAVPVVPAGTDFAGAVVAREKTGNTGIGMGWACPHARLPFDGDLICAIGWSPEGIDYGSLDRLPVRIVAMYLVPANQKSLYLKEISSLAKALQANTSLQHLETAADLDTMRNRLLDLVSAAKDSAIPEARVRMIQLESRQAVPPTVALAGLSIQPLMIVAGPGLKPVVLTLHREVADCLERAVGVVESLASKGSYETSGWRIIARGTIHYQADRVVYDCLAIRTGAGEAKPG
jgi:mannitol/fructose-specific phosphotransferase system IIA component (Ntr-type)